MISSVIYTPLTSQLRQGSTFQITRSPLFQIIIAKAVVLFLIFFLGDLLPQQIACIFVTLTSSLQFWLTKNLGRKYLQASWSVDTSGDEQIWIFQANFKTPSSMQEVFWYSQVVYGASLVVSACIILSMKKYSLLCAIVIATIANYVNFYAFSKIINIRNSGKLEQIADQANAEGEVRETIRLPIAHRISQVKNRLSSQSFIKSSVV